MLKKFRVASAKTALLHRWPVLDMVLKLDFIQFRQRISINVRGNKPESLSVFSYNFLLP